MAFLVVYIILTALNVSFLTMIVSLLIDPEVVDPNVKLGSGSRYPQTCWLPPD